MQWSRLFQPKNPLFWLMLALNALSPALAWVVHQQPLNAVGMVVVAGFAIGNALMGLWLVWHLMRRPPLPPSPPGGAADPATPLN